MKREPTGAGPFPPTNPNNVQTLSTSDLQVFGDPSNMERLQRIVWPEIKLLAEERISKMGEEGVESIVLEAAVMLEAGWDDLCEEVWTVQAPQDVARWVTTT